MLIHGFSKTGFGSVLRYAITLIVTITESIATTIFRSLFFSIFVTSFYFDIICMQPTRQGKQQPIPQKFLGQALLKATRRKLLRWQLCLLFYCSYSFLHSSPFINSYSFFLSVFTWEHCKSSFIFHCINCKMLFW